MHGIDGVQMINIFYFHNLKRWSLEVLLSGSILRWPRYVSFMQEKGREDINNVRQKHAFHDGPSEWDLSQLKIDASTE